MSDSSDFQCLIPSGVRMSRFEHLDAAAHSRILEWRNHPLVSRRMIRQDEISAEEHQAFVRSLTNDTSKAYYEISLEDPIGVIDYYSIDPVHHSAYYGYYLRPDRIGSSLGILLEYIVLEYGFRHLNLQQILAETHPSNTAALNLHRQFGASDLGINPRGLLESLFHLNDWMQVRLRWSGIVSRMVEPARLDDGQNCESTHN
ncbi:MAG: hypothetical protein BWY82_00819 [Verrucomicrobia bacterium ADurb.Bin474]|nr:MAG: hypothetical protein BWY82_00819 [Verrucomicrobia bacterium ADurb.Bin474]